MDIQVKNLIKLYAVDWTVTALAGLTTAGIIDAYVMELDFSAYLATTGALWLVRTIPNVNSLTSEASRQYLGLKEKQLIKARESRAAKLVRPGDEKMIFFSQVKNAVKAEPRPMPELPDLFLVEDVVIPGQRMAFDYELIDYEVDDFIAKAWKRQFYFKPPFSRDYWLNVQKWTKKKYYAALKLLLDVDLIVNRGRGSSGQLTLPANRAKRHVRLAYALG